MSHNTDLLQSVSGITTNGDGPILDLSLYGPVSCLSMVVLRTAGSTDIVNITLRISLDGVNFTDVTGKPGSGFGAPIDVTNLGSGNNPGWAGVSGLPFLFARFRVQDVGSGNILTIQLLSAKH